MKKKYAMAVILVAAVVLAWLGFWYFPQGKMERYEAAFFDIFDTVTTITGYTESEEEFAGWAERLQDRMQHYHEMFDIYHTYEGINNIKSINDAAGIEPVKVDGEIIDLLKLGREMYQRTGGKVNIAYGSVLSVWHEYREAGISEPEKAQLPPEELLGEGAEHTDIQKMVIDEEASTVFLEDPKMRLDVGSIGKGFAVQRLAEYAQEIGMEHALFSVGGNVCAVGDKADGTPWRVGIEDPNAQGQETYMQTVDIVGRCLVTSGDYQRYYEVDGKRYCHIINPDTGMPAEYFPSVTVLAEDSGVADALSTSLFNMELEEGMAFVEGLEGVEAMWIMEDGKIRCSSGFKLNKEE